MVARLAFSPNRSAFSLPGAWPSTDSLEDTLELPNANADPLDEEPLSISSDIPRTEGVKRRSVPNAAGQRSLRNSVATYDGDSDDFYSFVDAQEGDGDVEAASFPDADRISSVSINIENSGSIISKYPGTLSTSASLDHTEDATSSDDTSSSSQKMSGAPETPISSPPSDVSHYASQSGCGYRRTFLIPLTKDAGPTPRTSLVTASSRRSINSRSSSSGSAHLGDEEFSYHLDHSEDESAVSPTQVYNVIDEVLYTNNSQESLPIHMHSDPPRARRSLQIQRRVIGNQDSPALDILHLAQPDGDNPWTLSLEPTLLNLSESATASRTSVSIESLSITHDLAPAASSEPRLQTPVSPHTPTAQTFSIPQIERRPEIGLGRPSVDLRPPHYAGPPSYSGLTIPPPTQKKDVVQKTKVFYQKMKRFFMPKSSKRTESKGISNETSITPPRNTSFSTPSPFSSPYANESSSQWSLSRRAFQRYAKSSAPSVAHSCTPDIPYGSSYHLPPGMTQESRHTFESRRTMSPKTTNKRNRRFSVPTPFYASSLAPSAPSSSRNRTASSSRPFGKRWSRINESEH